MASAIIAAISVYGATAGAVVGGVTIGTGTALALGAAAAAATMLMEKGMAMDTPSQAAVSTSDKATPIDKTQMQEEAKVGKLKLGEDDEKAKRKRGKAAFKKELDTKEAGGDTGNDTGVQITKPKDLGVQL